MWPSLKCSSLHWQNSCHRFEEAHCWASALTWGKGTSPKVPPIAATVPIGRNGYHFDITAPTRAQHLRIGLSVFITVAFEAEASPDKCTWNRTIRSINAPGIN